MTAEKYALFYIRNKQKQETDFLITKDKKPWLLLEAKYSDSRIDNHHLEMQKMLGDIPFVQICREENICMLQQKNVYRISASRFLS